MLRKKILSDKYVDLVYKLFKNNGWSIDENAEISHFDRFCHRLAYLSDDNDRDFMLELSKNYLWIKLEKYEELLYNVFEKIFSLEDTKFQKNEKIFICPLLMEKKFNSIKSSTFMLYLCQGVFLRQLHNFHEEQIRICETAYSIEYHKKEINKIIVLDDFIGSGETALGCIEFLKSKGIDSSNIIIIALVAQSQGIEVIKKQNVAVFSSIERNKGISDYFKKEDLVRKQEQMKKISKHLKVPDSNLFLGYSDCESLVTMHKTPNNTFPFYWFEKDINTYAPFPRRQNIKIISEVKNENKH